MDYQRAADIRKKGLFSLITDKLVSGQGVGSSIGSAISERTQATVEGIKAKFDPLNIVKTLTFGSNLAPALFGRLLGRKREDIAYFAGGKKNKLKKMMSGGLSSEQSTEVLNLIYEQMLRNEEERKLEDKLKEKERQDELKAEDKRNSEIIAALSGKKIKKKIKKIEKPTEKKKPKEKPVASVATGLVTAAAAPKFIPTVAKVTKEAVSTVTKVGPGAAVLGAATIVGGGALTLAQAVGAAEAGGSYNVAFGDREDPKTGKVRNIMGLKTAEEFSGKKLSEMTLEEIKKFQEYRNKEKKNTGAVGKYQFVGTTLFGTKDRPGLVQRLGLPMDTKFSPQVQDQLNQTLFQDNVKLLQRNGVPTTPGNLYMAHYIGAGGATAVYKAAQRGEDVTVARALVNAGLPDPSVQNRELTEIKVKDFESVLQSRLEKKGYKATAEPSIPMRGEEIDKMSKENREAKRQADLPAPEQKVLNTSNISSSNQNTPVLEKEDDRSAYDKKVKQR